MVEARAALHRRCGPHYVADRRRRREYRRPGRGRRLQYPGRATQGRPTEGVGSRSRAGAPPMAGARDTGDAALPPEQDDRADPRRHASVAPALAGAAAGCRAVPAPHPRAPARAGRAARTCEDPAGLIFRTASLLGAKFTSPESLMIMSEPEARGPEDIGAACA